MKRTSRFVSKTRGNGSGMIGCIYNNYYQVTQRSSSYATEAVAPAAESTYEVKDVIPPKEKRDYGKDRAIYLDAQATTPVDPRVLDVMLPLYLDVYGNPHSSSHMYGWETSDMVEEARASVADLIGARPNEIIFTSGATESNNMAIKGVANFYKNKKHIITTQTEHKCVLDTCRHLEVQGHNDITYLPVKPNGIIDLNVLKSAIRPDTGLISIMAVNNEIGVIQPLREIGLLARQNKILFHTDAAQAIGKIPLNVKDLNIDLMSISAHKLYGPKGIGALYRRSKPVIRLEPIINGGGQERGLRSGTLPAPLIVGFGKACQISKDERERDAARIKKLFDRLYNGIREKIPEV